MRSQFCLIAWLALAGVAQAQPAASYTVGIWPGTATSTTAPPINTRSYSASVLRCGLTTASGADPEINPVEGRFDDPANATKDCSIDVTAQVATLGLNTLYKGAIRAGTGIYSALSNGFLMQAVTHPCDATPVSKTNVLVGQAFELGWCHDGKDTNGNLTTVTGFKVYRNGIVITATVTTDPTANSLGLKYSHVSLSESAAGTASYDVSATNVVGESAKVGALSLTATPPASAPTAPSRGRIL